MTYGEVKLFLKTLSLLSIDISWLEGSRHATFMSIKGPWQSRIFPKSINSTRTETRTGHLEMRHCCSEYNVSLPIFLWSTTIFTFIYKTYDVFLLLPVSLQIKVNILRDYFYTRKPTRGAIHYYLWGKKKLYYFLDKLESAIVFMLLNVDRCYLFYISTGVLRVIADHFEKGGCRDNLERAVLLQKQLWLYFLLLHHLKSQI